MLNQLPGTELKLNRTDNKMIDYKTIKNNYKSKNFSKNILFFTKCKFGKK